MLDYIKILVFAGAASFLLTPAAKVIAHKVNAIDVPKDNRRMHTTPIPRLGGLAIYGSIILSILVFLWPLSIELQAIIFGASVIVVSGFLSLAKNKK